VNGPTTAASLCLVSQEECMPWSHENNWTKAGWYPVRFSLLPLHYRTNFHSSKFSRNPGSMPKKYRHVLSTSGKYGKYIAGFLLKSYVGVVGVRCWRVPLAGRQVTVFLLRKLCRCRQRKSQPFNFGVGLRQWCVLSPLFSLYQGSLHNGSRAKSDLWSHFTRPQCILPIMKK